MAGYFLSSLIPYFLKYKDRMFQVEPSCQDDGRLFVQTENLKCFPFFGLGRRHSRVAFVLLWPLKGLGFRSHADSHWCCPALLTDQLVWATAWGRAANWIGDCSHPERGQNAIERSCIIEDKKSNFFCHLSSFSISLMAAWIDDVRVKILSQISQHMILML